MILINTFTPAYLLTYSMEQSLSWEANQFAANQEIHHILWNLKVHHSIYKCLPPVPTLSKLDPIHAPHPTSWISIFILSAHLRLGLPSGLFLSNFPTKAPYTHLISPYALHVQPISFFLILSLTQYWVMNTDH